MTEADYIELLLQHQVTGVVFAGGLYAQADAPHGHYARACASGSCRPCWSTRPSTASASRASRATTRWPWSRRWATSISLGHTRIGLLLGPPDHVPSNRKLEAARGRWRTAGSPLPSTHVVRSLYSLEAAQAAALRLLGAGVTGIVCASDPMALGAIRAARRAGLAVPADVSVVGYDDSALMNCTEPPLTTVRQPIEAMGRMVIELLVGQMDGAAVAARRAALRARAGGAGVDGTRPHRLTCTRPPAQLMRDAVKFLRSSCRVMVRSGSAPAGLHVR